MVYRGLRERANSSPKKSSTTLFTTMHAHHAAILSPELGASTSQVLTGHWRKQVDELLDEARQAEEGVKTARQRVQELIREHRGQWQASVDR